MSVGRHAMLLMLGAALACDQAPRRTAETADSTALGAAAAVPGSACEMPAETTTILESDGAVLETWTLRSEGLATDTVLPDEPAFLSYRLAIERDGADVRRPVADAPIIRTEAEAEIWRDEYFNNDLVFEDGVGSIDPISCLDALLFSRQASRVSQIQHPTEFIASVLRRESGTGPDLLVVFGAGSEMFPPRDVYGFELVEHFLAEGWSYWYAIHNHTVQKNGDLLALGVPAPSTSDVGLYRYLVEEMGLEFVRVTNGFYTFSASADELRTFGAR